MGRVCFFMLPEPGHYLPTLQIAHRLRGDGNEVCYLTIPHFEKFFRQEGFATLSATIPGLPENDSGHFFDPGFINQAVGSHLNKYLTHANLELQEFIRIQSRAIDCDLLICDGNYGNFLGPIAPSLSRNVVFMKTSLPMAARPSSHSDCLELIPCPFAFEISQSVPPPMHRIYGEPSIFRRRATRTFPWRSLDAEKPLIYCSFGSQAAGYPLVANTLQCLVSAFALLPEFQIVLVVDMSLQENLSGISRNVLVVESAPQPDLLDRAALFITHGGLGSIKESIMAKVPMIVVPFAYDQPENAERVKYHGLGTVLMPAEITPDRLAELVSALAYDKPSRVNLEAMRRIFSETEQRAPIAAFLEDLLKGRQS
jgi:UDP:flavonoid glycosyltransferase YjiC (YdhE family)